MSPNEPGAAGYLHDYTRGQICYQAIPEWLQWQQMYPTVHMGHTEFSNKFQLLATRANSPKALVDVCNRDYLTRPDILVLGVRMVHMSVAVRDLLVTAVQKLQPSDPAPSCTVAAAKPVITVGIERYHTKEIPV